MSRYHQFEQFYQANLTLFWGNLSRLNNLAIILNISLFFLTGLVTQGYYFTFFSLACYGLVTTFTLLPLPIMQRLSTYLSCLLVDALGGYFLIASIIYWIQHSPSLSEIMAG